ncbi:UNVERIFIED_CONTAM: hypothetical protein Scaly_0240400 [Sesamum calycinum]|uniref:RIC1 C-terminal alpha solenoid region domain-containing protein n=1 Tax=Sesamum calycinum TaxID=2727403 RepID=A0AAW2T0I7_9LAMI
MAAGHPLEAPNCVSTQQIVYLKVVNRLLLVVSPTHIELWSSSQHRVRLGKYKRDVDSIRKEGENLRAVWSPDTKLIAVLVSIESLDKMEAFRKANLLRRKSLEMSEFLPVWSNFICDNKHLLIGLSDGSLYNISWKGEKGLRHADSITVERRVASGDVVCASVAPEQQILAVGTRKGTVELYDLADSASLIRSVALHDWGYLWKILVLLIVYAWTPDDSAFAVGWKLRGLTVWSVSGCRLMSTIRQIGLGSVSSPVVKAKPGFQVSYILQNWPVLHVAASRDGMYLAVAGLNGLILYDIRLSAGEFWRCSDGYGGLLVIWYELLFYPRYHLDQSSLLCRKPLLSKPVVMDVYQDYLLVTYHPFDVHIYHVKLTGELSPSSTPALQLSTVRELSIMTAKSHPAAMRFIPDQLPRDYTLKSDISSSSDLLAREPSRCLMLRMNGDLSLLDLDDGRERELTDSVELFWVTCGQSEEKNNLIEEVSWLDYGHRGMQLIYRFGIHLQVLILFKQEDFLQLDPELEFDREVYPLGLLPNAGVVVGVSQRMSFSASTEFPCFEPSPQAQTILHCLLRHLLQRESACGAPYTNHLIILGPWVHGPPNDHMYDEFYLHLTSEHFRRTDMSHTTYAPQNSSKIQAGEVNHAPSLLEKTCDLIRNFPEYYDVVVSVARKTDGRHWADLFSAAGRSTELFEECFQRRWYRTAACYILVIAKLEGPAVSQYCALRLLQATLDESLYELAGELVRFLLRSGRE